MIVVIKLVRAVCSEMMIMMMKWHNDIAQRKIFLLMTSMTLELLSPLLARPAAFQTVSNANLLTLSCCTLHVLLSWITIFMRDSRNCYSTS